MHAAQAAGCGPIVTMIRENSDILVPVRPQTVAKSLAIGNPADGYYAAEAVRASGGWAAHATDEEIVEAMELLARTEGIFAETAGGVTLAAARKLVSEGRIGRDEPVVVCITGSGLKTVEALERQLTEPMRVGASLSAVEAVLPELQAITTR
jgi:threonine synthase